MTIKAIGADNRHVLRLTLEHSFLKGKFLTIDKSYLLKKNSKQTEYNIHDAPLSILDDTRDNIMVQAFLYNDEYKPYWVHPTILLSPKRDLEAYYARKAVNLMYAAERNVANQSRIGEPLTTHTAFIAMARALGAKEIWFPMEVSSGKRYRVDDIRLPDALKQLMDSKIPQAA
ncbi:hypothetical protein [Vibrio barjaei]|uniref:hypothetical protein n=1 Tax=Vibrio barjaei TaxID=1676683 RepID=UPI002283B847|nr:hypothetical protein [Vibrio barjaei]MCY9874029.1 hypothetical protein [Vibrio barjaei]